MGKSSNYTILVSQQRFTRTLLTVISNPATSVFGTPQSVGAIGPLEDIVAFGNSTMEDGIPVFESLKVVESTGLRPELWTRIFVTVTIVLTIVAVEVTVCSTKLDSVEAAEVVTGRREDSSYGVETEIVLAVKLDKSGATLPISYVSVY